MPLAFTQEYSLFSLEFFQNCQKHKVEINICQTLLYPLLITVTQFGRKCILICFLTARVRSTREGNVLTRVCVSVHNCGGGGLSHPRSGGTQSQVGGTPSQVWGVPHPMSGVGGTPARSGWWGGTPARS